MRVRISVRSEASEYGELLDDLTVGFCELYPRGPHMLLTTEGYKDMGGPGLVEMALTRDQVEELRLACEAWLTLTAGRAGERKIKNLSDGQHRVEGFRKASEVLVRKPT